jgi:hypothetical protein
MKVYCSICEKEIAVSDNKLIDAMWFGDSIRCRECIESIPDWRNILAIPSTWRFKEAE